MKRTEGQVEPPLMVPDAKRQLLASSFGAVDTPPGPCGSSVTEDADSKMIDNSHGDMSEIKRVCFGAVSLTGVSS